jgi:hypothetical protein
MNRRNLVTFGTCALALFLLAQPAHALYLFYMRRDLARLIKKAPKTVVGKQVVVTDELVVLWPEVQQRKDRLKGQKYRLFDTTHFRCAVPSDKMGTHLESIEVDARTDKKGENGYAAAIKQIEDVNERARKRELSPEQANTERRKLYWELHRVFRNAPILTIYGTVQRADFWGPVKGKANGVGTEIVTIVVDKIEKPRKRWYRSLDQ